MSHDRKRATGGGVVLGVMPSEVLSDLLADS